MSHIYQIRTLKHFWTFLCSIAAVIVGASGIRAADHGDTPLLVQIARHDTRIAGLHAFTRGTLGDRLVIALGIDPTIPTSATDYVFPTDVKYQIFIDNDSEVSFDDLEANDEFGGKIVNPKGIQQDIKIKITFDSNNVPRMQSNNSDLIDQCLLFSGLRDDPFIRGPRIGRNIGAIVLECPLFLLRNSQSTLLIWATAKAQGVRGPFQELAGRAFRSMFPENDLMNTLHPSKHQRDLGVPPDVVIFNTDNVAAFPNGRDLPDDVVDLVGDPRPLANDDPFPSENDTPFLDAFPYLAEPHLP